MSKYYISNNIQFIRGLGELVDSPAAAKHVSRAEASRFLSAHPDHVSIQLKQGTKRPYIISTLQKYIGVDDDVVYSVRGAKAFTTVEDAYKYLDSRENIEAMLGKPIVINDKYVRVKRPAPEAADKPEITKRIFFSPETRKLIYGKSNVCAICGKPITEEDFTIDHIVPLSRGGNNKLENLRPTHEKCNLLKGNLLDMELLNMIATIGANNLYNSPISDLSARFIRAIVRGTINQFTQGGDIYREIRMEN